MPLYKSGREGNTFVNIIYKGINKMTFSLLTKSGIPVPIEGRIISPGPRIETRVCSSVLVEIDNTVRSIKCTDLSLSEGILIGEEEDIRGQYVLVPDLWRHDLRCLLQRRLSAEQLLVGIEEIMEKYRTEKHRIVAYLANLFNNTR